MDSDETDQRIRHLLLDAVGDAGLPAALPAGPLLTAAVGVGGAGSPARGWRS